MIMLPRPYGYASIAHILSAPTLLVPADGAFLSTGFRDSRTDTLRAARYDHNFITQLQIHISQLQIIYLRSRRADLCSRDMPEK